MTAEALSVSAARRSSTQLSGAGEADLRRPNRSQRPGVRGEATTEEEGKGLVEVRGAAWTDRQPRAWPRSPQCSCGRGGTRGPLGGGPEPGLLPLTESPRKSRPPPSSPLLMELASGQGLAQGLSAVVSGEEEEWGGVGGASLTQVFVQGQGAGRVQAEGKMRFPEMRPSFFSAFLSNAIPFRNGLEGEEQLGPGLCEFSCWLPRARPVWPGCRQWAGPDGHLWGAGGS